jgi:signal transduction histidine kinase
MTLAPSLNDRRTGLSRYYSKRSLSVQLFLITILPLTALLLAITFGSLALHQKAMRDLVGERDALAVRTAAAAIAEQVRQRANTMRMLALEAQGLDRSTLANLLASRDFLQTDFDAGLAFYDRNGKMEIASYDPAVWQALAPTIQSTVGEMVTREEVLRILPSRVEHPSNGQRLVMILHLTPDSQRIAIGAFSAASLASSLLNVYPPNGRQSSFVLVDQEGKTIYRLGYLFSEEDFQHHAGLAESLRGESGVTFQSVGKSEHVIAYSPVETLGWGLVSEEAWEMLDTPLLRATQAAPLVLVPALLLAVIALWFAARQIIRPLQELETKAAQLADGDFQSITTPVGGIAEIQRLQSEMIQMAQQVKVAQQSLHHYIGAITSAQEDERRRLARELHDDTIQALIALKQRVQIARLRGSMLNSANSLDEIADLTEHTIENLRRLTRALRPIYLEELGLVAALKMLAQETSQVAGLRVSFNCQGDERRLEAQTELALYRIAQEALNNVARHSHASSASVNLTFAPQSICLEIQDDGVGFRLPHHPSEFAAVGHYGLLGLQERAELIGAKLKIESAPGQGTRLEITL